MGEELKAAARFARYVNGVPEASSSPSTAGEVEKLLQELSSSLDMYDRHGPDLTCAEGEFIHAATLLDRRELIEAARAALQTSPSVERMREALEKQTALVDRLLSAVERAEQDIGGESPAAVLPILGPANDQARAALSNPVGGTGWEGAAARCQIPPFGWWCSRAAGHEGPCAARPINPVQDICDALYRRFDDEPDFLGHEAAAWMEIAGEALQRIHRYALAAEGAGYDLILSVTAPLVDPAPPAALTEESQDVG